MAHGSLDLDDLKIDDSGELRITGLHLQRGVDRPPPQLAPWFADGTVDPLAVDAVAVGLVAHELLTGEPPPDPPPAAGLDPGARVPGELREAIVALTRLDPEARISLREAAVSLRTDVASTVDVPLESLEADGSLGQAGRYELRSLLGTGAHGVVYRAWDPELHRDVALKRLKRAPDGRTRERLIREARAAARLSHPNIVGIHDVGRDAAGDWFTMDLVDGPTLEDRGRGGALAWTTAVSWVAALAEGLQHAHDAGLVHRDIKPANVLLDGDRPRLADFGLAYDDADLQAGRGIAGTPLYMAPEQVRDRGRDVGPHTDVYALGVVLIELLTGRNPFLRPTIAEVLEAVRQGIPDDLAEQRPDLPEDLMALVARAADPVPARRPTAGELARSLHEILLRTSSLETKFPPLPPPPRRGPLLALGAGGLVAVALLAATPWAWTTWQASAREARAQERVDEVVSRMEQTGGDHAQAAFEGLVSDPELVGTDALARAWLTWAERRAVDRSAADDDEVLRATARAYALSRTAETRDTALLRLAEELRLKQRWDGLVAAVDQLNRLAVPVPLGLARDAAAAGGDLSGAAALVDDPELSAFLSGLRSYLHTGGVEQDFVCSWRGPEGLDQLMRLQGERGEQRMMVLDRHALSWDDAGAWPTRARCGPARHDLYGESVRVVSQFEGSRAVRMELFVWKDGALQIRPLPPHELVRFEQRRGDLSVSGDIDGDGILEVWMAVRPDRVVGFRIPPAGEGDSEAITIAPELAAVDSWALPQAVADVDGDGDDELLVHVREFGAYDLRAYDLVDGESVLERRLQTGDLRSVAMVPGTDPPTVAMQVLETPPEPALFPGPEHLAAQPGVHLLTPAGRSWTPTALIDDTSHPVHARGWRSDAQLIPYDLDLDGHPDFIASSEAGTRILMHRPDGYETVAHLPYVRVRGVAELDGDPAPELLVLGGAEEGGINGVLGIGQDPWTPPTVEPAETLPPPDGLSRSDQQLWSQIEVLIRMGLFEVASTELEQVAARYAGTPLAEQALARAAAVQADHGELAEARRLFEAAREAAAPAPRVQTLHGLGEVLARLVDLQAAGRLAEVALARPDLAPDDRAWWEALAEQAAAVSSAGEVRGPGSLDAWTVEDPLALRVEEDGAWHVVGTARTIVLTREVQWDGTPITIDWDLDIGRLEPPAHVLVLLDPLEPWARQGHDPVLQRVFVGAEGSATAAQLVAGCQQPAWMEQYGALPPSGSGQLSLWLGLDLAAPSRFCAPRLSVDGDLLPSTRRFGGAPIFPDQDPEPGRYRLSVEIRHRWSTAATGKLGEATIRDLVVHGVSPIHTPPEGLTAAHAAHRALAAGRPDEALGALRDAPQDLDHDLARLVVAEELGDLRLAREAIGRLWSQYASDRATRSRLYGLLRSRPQRMARLLAPALGDQWPELAWSTWQGVARHPDTLDPGEVKDLELALATLDDLSPDRLDARGRRALTRLLILRAGLMRRLDRLPRARGDRRQALALLDDLPDPDDELAQALLREEVLGAAAEGDLDEALAAAERLLAVAPDPPTAVDALDAHPDLDALRAHPGWESIRAARLLPPGGWPW